jgi:hypothetical protein
MHLIARMVKGLVVLSSWFHENERELELKLM